MPSPPRAHAAWARAVNDRASWYRFRIVTPHVPYFETRRYENLT